MKLIHYPVKRSTLAKEVYRISEKTFAKWLRNIGITHQKTLSPADIKRIVGHYDLPDSVEIK